MRPQPSSAALAFFHRFLLGLGALDLSTCGQPLVAQNPQLLDLGTLARPAEFQHLDIARAGHAVFIGRLFLVRHRAPEHQQLTDVLDRRGVELRGQLLVHHLARGAVVTEHPHLDQSVRIERSIDFLAYGVAQAVVADQHDRVQMVRMGAAFPALGGGQFDLGHTRIILQAMKAQPKTKKVNKTWLHDHINDPYVKLAQKEGYRARAAYKLKEIDEQLGLIKPGQVVVDLGSAPGAWSQYLRRRLSPAGAAVGQLDGTIIALDLLPMEPIEGVLFLQGDFREDDVVQRLNAAVQGRAVDVVVSDMAPNLSGLDSVDAARVEHLIELAVEFAVQHLKPGGALVVKVFHGSGYTQLVQLFKDTFQTVKTMKPKSSRDRSAETFLVGMRLKTGR